MAPVRVEVLWSPGCAHAEALRSALRAASRACGVPIDLAEHEVATPEQARALRMPGSPTVRIAGRDVEPGTDDREDFGLG